MSAYVQVEGPGQCLRVPFPNFKCSSQSEHDSFGDGSAKVSFLY